LKENGRGTVPDNAEIANKTRCRALVLYLDGAGDDRYVLPVIKVSTNSGLATRWHDLIDITPAA
jgi:hypothetical protein